MKIGLNMFSGNKIFKKAACGIFGTAALITAVSGCTIDSILVKDSESIPRYNRPSFAPVVGFPDGSGAYREVVGESDGKPIPVVGLKLSH